LRSPGSVAGYQQQTIDGKPQTPGKIASEAFEWSFPVVEVDSKATTISGSSAPIVNGSVGYMQPAGSHGTASCIWQFGQGAAAPTAPSALAVRPVPMPPAAAAGTTPGAGTQSGSGTGAAGGGADQPRTVSGQMRVLSGNNQSAAAGTALAQPIVVEITSSSGPLPSTLFVNFFAHNGGEATDPAGLTAVQVAARVDAQGHASVKWRLGDNAGDNSLVATVYDLAGARCDINEVDIKANGTSAP
jgi:hypothetical protein